jgi:hypothetical protein
MADPQPSGKRRRFLTSALAAVCVLSVGGALTACGTAEQDRDEPAALDTVRLGKIKRLSSSQYQAIKGVFDAGNEVDRLDNEGLDAEIILQPVLDACADGAGGDPLLVPLLADCTASVRFVIAVAETLPCAGTDACSDFYDDARQRLQAATRAARVKDRAVSTTRLPRACKRVLTNDESYYLQRRRYDRALAALQATTRTASTGDDAIAARRLARAFNFDPSGGSDARKLRTLRRNCRQRS